jgi:hypothetical protein
LIADGKYLDVALDLLWHPIASCAQQPGST